MKIEFLFEEKALLSAKYIKLITKKDFVKIIVKKEDIKSVNFQFGNILNKDLDVKISRNFYEKFTNIGFKIGN